MSVEKVKAYLAQWNKAQDVLEPQASTATVDEAALTIGVEAARIAKTISVYTGDKEHAKLIVVAGDAKLDNLKFKAEFGYRPRMLSGDDVERLTGHQAGGVCPFANPSEVQTFLDVSLKRFDTAYPACGSSHSLIKLTIDELYELSQAKKWVDVCKAWDE